MNHCAWHHLPVFGTVCRLLTCLQSCGSRLRALWLWPSAWRCCRSGARLSSAPPAPPASPTSPTSGSQAADERSALHSQLLSMDSSLLPVVSPRFRRHNSPSAASNSCWLSHTFHHCLFLQKALRAGPGVSAAASSWHGGFETKPGDKCKNT